jgi:hypothetical protein
MSHYVMGDDGNSYIVDPDGNYVGAAPAVRLPTRALGPVGRPAGMLRLPPKPPWRMGEVAPGVWGPQEGEEILPLTPASNSGVLTSAFGTINYIAEPQRPFKGERLIVNIRRSAGATAVRALAAQFAVGTQPQQVELGNFDLESFLPNSVGIRMSLTPAQPGMKIQILVVASPAVPVGETVAVSIDIIGKSLR